MQAIAATPPSDPQDSLKRQQILDGARACFLAQGFDGASMNDIVKAAGVSKGTVYAYFPSKERLFEALISQDRRKQAEQVIALEDDKRPIADVLFDVGMRLLALTTADASMAYVRMVIAISGKFPEVGQSFYEAGPAYATARIADYLKTKMDEGVLMPADPDLAAMQFAELVQCAHLKPRLFTTRPVFKQRSHEEAVRAGVALFIKGMAP